MSLIEMLSSSTFDLNERSIYFDIDLADNQRISQAWRSAHYDLGVPEHVISEIIRAEFVDGHWQYYATREYASGDTSEHRFFTAYYVDGAPDDGVDVHVLQDCRSVGQLYRFLKASAKRPESYANAQHLIDRNKPLGKRYFEPMLEGVQYEKIYYETEKEDGLETILKMTHKGWRNELYQICCVERSFEPDGLLDYVILPTAYWELPELRSYQTDDQLVGLFRSLDNRKFDHPHHRWTDYVALRWQVANMIRHPDLRETMLYNIVYNHADYEESLSYARGEARYSSTLQWPNPLVGIAH